MFLIFQIIVVKLCFGSSKLAIDSKFTIVIYLRLAGLKLERVVLLLLLLLLLGDPSYKYLRNGWLFQKVL